ncbi:MFS transporter [Paeniglutamicibacter sp. ABSL32-1]|uniref:MFS transporter n=1 Tax=Paeniglutamicibacter quisquiliarum TaxID=2849498 RepID=UPI001C2CD729|nr:MFS transporter [Paeniglutamicibacter quisquiliarum]MBV1778106.1 MFS transporter [Paeniglutamicibacter quisquiliarum]
MAPRALRPFAHRDYRILLIAMAISVFAHGMWAVAMVYQVKHLGGGPAQLSVVATATSLGLLGFVLIGGITADRVSCRKIIILVEAVSLAVMTTVAVLALTGAMELWHLAVAGFIQGAGAAFFFPAYSALLPRILPAEDLLAANGMEGMFRPVLQQAAGPAIAGVLVASFNPAMAVIGIAACHLVAFLVLNMLGHHKAYDAHLEPNQKRPSVLADLREAVGYTVGTPWLLWTLLFAVISVLSFIGPIEVLLPFVVEDQLGGDAKTFGFMLAAYGIGSAIGSMVTSSFPLPRRYLTFMIMFWGFGTLPLALIGLTSTPLALAIIMVIPGITGGLGQVIWGTLLQRRVPHHMLGRISSLDFFVSLALMPVSMALAGPLAEVIPLWMIFVVAGVASPVIGVVAWFAGRMYRDEIEHPLDREAAPQPTDA